MAVTSAAQNDSLPLPPGPTWPGWKAVLAIFLIWAAAVLYYGKTQAPVSQNGGKGWDGSKYHAMYEQAARGESLRGEKPYIYRVATPFLAAKLGKALDLEVRAAFHAVNLASVLLTAWLLLSIQSVLGVRIWVAVFLTATFLLQWHAPLRQQFYDSFNVDAASQPFTCLILLLGLLARRRAGPAGLPSKAYLAALTAATFIGVFFRESVIFATGALWLVAAWDRYRAKGLSPALLLDRALLAYALPILAGLLGIGITRVLAAGEGNYSFIVVVLYFLYHKPPLVVLHAFFNGYGTVIIPGLLFAGLARREIAREPLLGVYLLICLVLGWTAGGDTTRINYWGCMTGLPLLGLVLSRLKIGTAGVGLFLALEIVTTRMLFPMPDYPGSETWRLPLLTNWGTDFPYFDLWSELANPRVLMISLFQYLALLGLGCLWIRRRGKEGYIRDLARLSAGNGGR